MSEIGYKPLPDASLREVKEGLGPLEIIEIEAKSLPEAHLRLGVVAKEPLRLFLKHKLAEYSPEERKKQKVLAKEFLTGLEGKSNHRLIGTQVSEYLESLRAWAKGADIKSTIDQLSPEFGDQLSELELALWLQNDNVGCITVMQPTKAGSVLVMHTEEEELEGDEARKPKIAKIIVGDKTYYSYLYPDLLPGSAFSWDETGRFMAVDALYLKEGRGRALANAAVWMIMFNQNGFKVAEKIIKALGPYYDGYAVNLVEKGQAKKIVFAHDQLEKIPVKKNNTSFQVSTVDPNSKLIRLQDIDKSELAGYELRRAYLTRFFQLLKSFKFFNLETFTRALSFKLYGQETIRGPWVRASLAAEIGANHSEIRVFAGPVLKEEAKGRKYQAFTADYNLQYR